MKTAFVLITVLLTSVSMNAASAKANTECNTLLSGESPELAAAIHELSKLRYDLDVAVSQGENSAAKRAMQMRYDEKEKEILHSAKVNQEELIARIRAEIESIQKEANTQQSRHTEVKEKEQKAIEKAKKAERPLKVGTYVKIPAGNFMMGHHDLYEVILTQDYEMQTTVVTQKQYLAVTSENPSRFQDKEHCPETWVAEIGCPENPVEMVSWNDAQAFIQLLNAEDDGYLYRLPTEAEWEYAAKAGTTTEFYWGDQMDDDYAWHEENSGKKTHEVARKKPNAYGLYDLSGNVCEWISGWNWVKEMPSAPIVNPQGTVLGSIRMTRGGSWDMVRGSGFGSYSDAGKRESTIGFRLVRTVRNP